MPLVFYLKIGGFTKISISRFKQHLKGSVREKWKEVLAYCEKKALLIATNLNSICCVYKEKIIKNDSC